MKRFALLCSVALCSACAVSITSLKSSKNNKHSTRRQAKGNHLKAGSSMASGGTVIVDQNWMVHYKELEKKYNYAIAEDNDIQSDGGRFRVPQRVIDHNQDLLKAKP